MVISKRIMEHKATSTVEYVMYENHYGNGKITYSIAKRYRQSGEVIEWVVRNVSRSTVDAVWCDRVTDKVI